MTSFSLLTGLNVISLGLGCACRTELIRRYFPEQATHFFDYLGNYGGLDICTAIIKSDFQDFQRLDDFQFFPHPKWNTTKELLPISLCINPPGTIKNILVSRRFSELAFFHYTLSADTIASFQRKAKRFRSILQDTERKTIFLYYRQYDEPLDGLYAESEDYSILQKLNRLEEESIRFRDTIEGRYPFLQFHLISLIMEPFSFHPHVTPAIDTFLREKANSSRAISFDRVHASHPQDKTVSAHSWRDIYHKHILTTRTLRFGKALLNLPFKLKKLGAAISKKRR